MRISHTLCSNFTLKLLNFAAIDVVKSTLLKCAIEISTFLLKINVVVELKTLNVFN